MRQKGKKGKRTKGQKVKITKGQKVNRKRGQKTKRTTGQKDKGHINVDIKIPKKCLFWDKKTISFHNKIHLEFRREEKYIWELFRIHIYGCFP